MIDELVRGEPDYDLLSEPLAQATREHLAALQQMFADLGPIESLTFVEVNAIGDGLYDVKLANGSVTWVIALGPDGKTMAAVTRPPG